MDGKMYGARAVVTAALIAIAIAIGCGVESLDLANKRCPCDESAGDSCDTASQKCVQRDCVGKSCKDLGFQCGAADDGCGRFLDCDQLAGCDPVRQVCQGNVCVACASNPHQCAAVHAQCGTVPDNCGGDEHFCGDCKAGEHCGGGGDHVCGTDAGCIPKTTCLPGDCGGVSDGCNGTLQCPERKTCTSYPGQCGNALSNGCGGTIQCGCETGRVCNADGRCCYTCESQGWQCGDNLSDGCGGTLKCGPCEAGTCNSSTHKCQL